MIKDLCFNDSGPFLRRQASKSGDYTSAGRFFREYKTGRAAEGSRFPHRLKPAQSGKNLAMASLTWVDTLKEILGLFGGLNWSQNAVQASWYQPVLDSTKAGHIVAAGNRYSDRVATMRMPTPIAEPVCTPGLCLPPYKMVS
jgi:hypothetical protein